MAGSGLIYAAIVAGWAAVLVPVWVRRNEEIERARAEDARAGVRVLDRRSRPRAHGHALPEVNVLPPASARKVVAPAGGRKNGPEAARHAVRRAEAMCRAGSRRRRRVLLVLLVALVAAVVSTALGWLPGGVAGVTGLLLTVFVVLARRTTRRESARLSRARRAAAMAAHAMPRQAPSRQLDVAVEAALDDEAAVPMRRLLLPDVPGDDDLEVVEDAAPPYAETTEGWEPVPVPLPTYVTAPKAPRVIRRIDLSTPGAWTSGRLEHAEPSTPSAEPVRPERTGYPTLPPLLSEAVEPPWMEANAAHADEVDDEPDEDLDHRRAVGD